MIIDLIIIGFAFIGTKDDNKKQDIVIEQKDETPT